MKRLTTEEYKTASALLKSKCFTLWKVENEQGGIQRDFAHTGFPINLSYIQKISNDDSIVVFENTAFARHIDEYQKAFRKDKSVFHKGNAHVILSLMYDFSIEKTARCSFEQYIQNVCTESCSYIMHQTRGEYDDAILRTDTFRMIIENENGADFIGGLFHSLNHFTIDEIYKWQRNYMFDVLHLLYLSAYAFFMGNVIDTDRPNTIIKTILNQRYGGLIKFVYYIEPNSNIGFIKTITITRTKKFS